MIPFKNYGWWPEPPSNMATTVIIERKFAINFNKIILKNPENGQLLSDFRKMIHLWLPFRIMVDNFNHHQTWLPPLLKIEHLTKKMQKLLKKYPVKCQLLPNFREIIQLWSSLSVMVNDLNFHQTWPPLLLKIESLTKKNNKKFCKVPIAWLIPFYIWWSSLLNI